MNGLLSTEFDLRARYSQGGGIYRLVPEAVARPRDADELRQLLRQAAAAGWPVTCRGAGSAMDGSSVGTGMVVDMIGFDQGRCEVDRSTASATVTPGLALASLDRTAARHGLRFPVDPSSSAWATLGGMASTNASGARSVRVGSARRWIEAITLETVDGPLQLQRGIPADTDHPVVRRWYAEVEPLLQTSADDIRSRYPAVRKNSAGYALDHYLDSGDLLDVVIGSEGTLGVITRLVVRLSRIPEARVSLRVAVRARGDLPAAIDLLRAADPATLEFLDASFLRLVAEHVSISEAGAPLDQAGGVLLMDIEGDDRAALIDRARAVAGRLGDLALHVRLAEGEADIARLWEIRHRASPILAGLRDGRRSLQVIEDGCVPVRRLADYLELIDQTCREHRVDAVMFGHAGDGHVHVNLLPNLRETDWLVRVRAIFTVVSEAVIRLGGTPSGEHGAGRLRAGLMERLYGPGVVRCFRAVKAAFDPAGRFNPGVILPDTADPFLHLKVGPQAAALPPGIAEQLERVEAEARWPREEDTG